MKIQVAIARKILVAVWHMLSKEEDFIDIYQKRLQEMRETKKQLNELESAWVDKHEQNTSLCNVIIFVAHFSPLHKFA